MPKVELIYDADCPNVDAARNRLRQACCEAAAEPQWEEWDRVSPTSPPYAQKYGSPTILVDGEDVAGISPFEGANCCRIYRDEMGQVQGVPSTKTIIFALQRGSGSTETDFSKDWQSSLAVVPAVGVALLPKLACPACWPAYAGLLSAVGLGYLTEAVYLLPLTLVFLVVAVAALGIRANRRRGYWPFALGVFAAMVVMLGKFVFESDMSMYGGIFLLIGASLWNTWPRRSTTTQLRRACCSTEQVHQIGGQ